MNLPRPTSLTLLTLLAVRAFADDVPADGLLWLQGYDGNPPRPGFAVEGVLRIEAIDDSQPVGLVLQGGGVTNRIGGTIRIGAGAGGSRFIAGSVINEGTFESNVAVGFPANEGLFRNTGTVRLSDRMVFLGRGTRMELADGEVTVPAGIDLQDGSVLLTGGTLDADLRLVRSQLEVAREVTAPVHVDFSGTNCAYTGSIRTNCTVSVWGGDNGSPAVIGFSGGGDLEGVVVLGSRGSSSDVTARLLEGSWTIRNGARLETQLGAGGSRRLEGDLRNEGRWLCNAGVVFTAQTRPLNNAASLEMAYPGILYTPKGFRQESGQTILLGGAIHAPSEDTVVAGGILSGGGRIYGRLVNQAEVDQKQWLGSLVVEGRYVQGPAGQLTLTLLRPETNQAMVVVTGSAQLDGVLKVGRVGGSVVQAGDRFKILQVQSWNGWFSDIQLPAIPQGLHWQVLRTPTTLELAALEKTTLTGTLTSGGDGTRLEVGGRVARRLRLEFSQDLRNWTPVAEQSPFPGFASIPVPTPPGSPSTRFYRTSLED